jgi:hypothetical protein
MVWQDLIANDNAASSKRTRKNRQGVQFYRVTST